MSDQRVFPSPGTNVENQPYWDAAKQGKLMVKFCAACNKNHFYPRALCPHCLSADTQWRESTGGGTIYSYSVMRRVPQPYAIAYVTLDDGVTMMTNIVDCDFDQLTIGQRVKVAFRQSDGDVVIPVFVPA